MNIDVNTVSLYPTHFLRAVELIILAREEYEVPSENWPHPLQYRFGIPNDNYYAEIWVDGMDWQPSYWIIEEYDLEKPHVNPLIIFSTNEARNIFNDYDFSNLLRAMMYYRRDHLWAKTGNLSMYQDLIWPYLHFMKNEIRYKKTKMYVFEHNSQPEVAFWLNEEFIPEKYRGKTKNYRNNWNSEEGQLRSI